MYTLKSDKFSFCRLQDNLDGASAAPEESGAPAVADEENDQFWCLDDIPGSLFV